MESEQTREQQMGKGPPSREERFVAGVLKRCAEDKGMSARLRRADNPATEYQSWELLAAYGVDLASERERLPFACVSAAIARSKAPNNGVLGLGRAIAACYEDGAASDQGKPASNQAKARLRRLLACEDLAELCRILRPLFSLIDSKSGKGLDYVRLLSQLRRFPFTAQQVKAQWAQEFYGKPLGDSEEDA